jgi:hypothetical protein
MGVQRRRAESGLNAEVLLNLGFVDVGRWVPSGKYIAYQLDCENASANGALLDAKNALYAFVSGDQVLYIGNTARSIRKRYVGYCRPGIRQATNLRCHRNILEAIAHGTSRAFVSNARAAMSFAKRKYKGDSGLDAIAPGWLGVEILEETAIASRTECHLLRDWRGLSTSRKNTESSRGGRASAGQRNPFSAACGGSP